MTYYEIKLDDNGFIDTLDTFNDFGKAFQFLKDCLTSYIDSFDYSINNTFSACWLNDNKGFTITEKEVAVRKVWNVSNTLGAFKSFTNKEDALKLSKEINDKIFEYLK